MKHLGIDYGTKHVGVALSDDEGRMAYPHSVIETSSSLANDIATLVDKESVQQIVIGNPGEDNAVYTDIKDFVGQLSLVTQIPIHFQDESLSSFETGSQLRSKPTARKPKEKVIKRDDAAAAIILQRFLDRS